MSKYDNFEFISSEILIAEIKQQLKSYFDSGSVTEALIPTYISTALRKLKKMALEYKEDIIFLDCFKVKLPSDFAFLDDVYLLNKIDVMTGAINTTVFDYYKKIYCNDSCENEYEEFTQTTGRIPNWMTTQLNPKLLKVYYGSKEYCLSSCRGIRPYTFVSGSRDNKHPDRPFVSGVNPLTYDQGFDHSYIASLDEVRIHKKTLTANFATGTLYLKYYTIPEDEHGPLIPDVIEVEDYVKAYVTFQLFDQLYNAVTDESINIIERKRQMYRQEYYGKMESANNMMKAQTEQQVRDGINRDRRRFVKFIIL